MSADVANETGNRNDSTAGIESLVETVVEQAAVRSDGLEMLIDRIGSHEGARFLRPLTFLLARTISRDGPSPRLAAAAIMLVIRMRCTDETARSNLLTALDLLARHGAFPAPHHPPPRLAAFLEECLGGGRTLRATAVGATTTLLEAGVRFGIDDLRSLRASLWARDEHRRWSVAAAVNAGQKRAG